MKAALFLGIVLLAICYVRAVDPTSSHPQPRTWTVNLDLPPAQRWPWKEMIPVYKQNIAAALQMIGQFVPYGMQWIFEDAAADIYPYMGEYGVEIESGAKLINVSLGTAILLNVVYDVTAGCTSIIARDPAGSIIHGRNLDYSLASVLRNLTINVEFTKGGKVVYVGTTYAGFVGLPTGMKKGGFAISLDERDTGMILENLLEAWLVPGVTGPTFLIRDALDKYDKYEDAVTALSKTPLVAPAYLITSGLTEAAVITRDRDGARDIWRLDSTRWFEVETNYDHWEATPASDPRRKVANDAMEKIGQHNITLDNIFEVLSTHPVLNPTTTYTALMSVTTGAYTSYVRDDADSLPPFTRESTLKIRK
eukprot:TRINITY_DN3247_c0_g1_i1.p1 TRINITY_DN3247_c0_g1~~TRINITY_DN3247_c0_g1_i1.p1  ORF type:complete len:378 (-),score=82.81 TRINITY_DN3247_c0_g1_i1:50-1144(-)